MKPKACRGPPSSQETVDCRQRHGVDKVGEGPYDPVRLIEDGQINIVVNTPRGRRARGDGAVIRKSATRHGVPCVTTIQGGLAVAQSLTEDRSVVLDVASLQDRHSALAES